MRVVFVSSDDAVGLVMSGGFRSLPSALLDGHVLLSEAEPGLAATRNGDSAVLLEAPEEVVSRFERPDQGDARPRSFELPSSVADGLPILAFRMNGAAPTAPPGRRLPRPPVPPLPVLAGLIVFLGVAAVFTMTRNGEDRSDSPRAEQTARPDAKPGTRGRSDRGEAAASERSPRQPSRAVGSPTDGRLVNGVALPAEGEHFFTWNIPRERSPNERFRRFGTDVVIERVLEVVEDYADAHPRAPRVGIADLSLPRGGEFGVRFGGSGHVGHRNGTEVDVLYPRRDGRELGTESADEVDRRLAQDLLDRFLEAGALKVTVDARVGLTAPPSKLGTAPLHEDHMHVEFSSR